MRPTIRNSNGGEGGVAGADQDVAMGLSLRLLRTGRTIEDALRNGHELKEAASDKGRLFIAQSNPQPPSWYKFVSEFAVARLPVLVNRSCGAVLFLPLQGAGKRTVALTFGTAHLMLEPDAFERNFGLKVVLNAVARSNLRGIDTATLDATTFQKRIQASRNADLQGFGIDIDRDLLRLASGSPRDVMFARSLTGKDALRLHAKVSADDVSKKCETAVRLYNASDYRKDFSFIDHVVPVQDRAVLDQLDELVFDELKGMVAGHPSDLHLCLPDILSPERDSEIGYFGIGLKPGRKQTFEQVAIEDYVALLKAGKFSAIGGMSTLKSSHEVRIISDGEGNKKERQRLYNCLVFEAELKGAVYVLFDGQWFCVDRDFYQKVDDEFQRLVKQPFLKKTKAESERELIKELDAKKELLNLDQIKLAPARASGANLEPCDFLSKDKQFIHLKDGHASAPISHLWNQGMVSAEAFVLDEKFRVDLRAAIKKREKSSKKSGFDKLVPDGRSKPVVSDYTIVFGVMRQRHKKSGTLGLPFFSKVSLRKVAGQIQLIGFAVEVHLIERP